MGRIKIKFLSGQILSEKKNYGFLLFNDHHPPNVTGNINGLRRQLCRYMCNKPDMFPNWALAGSDWQVVTFMVQ